MLLSYGGAIRCFRSKCIHISTHIDISKVDE